MRERVYEWLKEDKKASKCVITKCVPYFQSVFQEMSQWFIGRVRKGSVDDVCDLRVSERGEVGENLVVGCSDLLPK